MRSASTLRAWRELSRYRLRTLLTVLTLAVAVVGVWLFATPQQLGAAMDELVARDHLPDVVLYPDGVALDDAAVTRLRALANIGALDARATFFTEVRSGSRVQDVWIIGVSDFTAQRVNVVRADEGRLPVGPALEVVSDPQNDRSGRAVGAPGETVFVSDFRSATRALEIVGTGSSLSFGNTVVEGAPVLYAPIEVVWDLAGYDVFTRVEFTVFDRGDEATSDTIDRVRAALADLKPGVRYNALPDIRPEGQWPGEDDFDNFLVLFWVIAAVALVSAMVLVATTMNTLVRAQRQEIAIMKALGARTRRVAAAIAMTSLLFGVVGTAVGIAFGMLLSNLLIGFLGSKLIGAQLSWQVSPLAVFGSLAVGVGGTLLASAPAVRRATRLSVIDALGRPGIEGSFGLGRLDRAAGRATFLPRVAQLGVRNALRQKGRAAATIAQIALAVGTMLAFTATVLTMITVSAQSRDAEGGDIWVYTSGSGQALDNRAVEAVAHLAGVDRVQPLTYSPLLVGDTETFAWGLPADPIYPYELERGRWFTEAESRSGALVVVIGPALANVHHLDVGDHVLATIRDGTVEMEVVGIDTTMVGDGLALYVPIGTALSLAGLDAPTEFWVTTTSRSTDDIDRVNLAIRGLLAREGYAFDSALQYIDRAADEASDRTIVAVIMALGIPVVAIGAIGLVNTMTTNILERTREIGVLRSIGARGRDLRRVFLAEAAVLIFVGWLAGIVVGYGLARLILGAFNDAFDVHFALQFPLWPLAVALVLALVVSAMALIAPLRRASRLSASDALRYQ